MNFKEELTKAMNLLAKSPESIFIGQSIVYPGHIMTDTFKDVPRAKKVELPVVEDTQIGLAIGLSLAGCHPVIAVYPRMDFLIMAANQLINHLDKWEEMTRVRPHVIIRTMVGSIRPMYPGPQHSQDHTEALRLLMPNTRIVKLVRPEEVVPAYQEALEQPGPWVLVEAPPRREGYDV